MAAELGGSKGAGNIPVPDPTLLTTQALLREIGSLRELLETKIEDVDHRLDERLGSLKAIQSEKFAKVEQQFELVERQRVEQKQDTKTAVDAALSAQKEAVHEQTLASDKAISKSESGTTKQIEQLAENFRTANSGIITSIDDLKDRVRGIEATKAGASEVRTEARASTGQIMALVFGVVGVVAGIFSVIYVLVRIASGH